MFEKYIIDLKTKGMTGVMVNGLTGEGTTLTIEERVKLAGIFYEVTRKYDLKLLLNLGGKDLPELNLLAENAEKLKVDGILILPELL